MNSILKNLQDPKSFQTYIDEYMKTSTYKAEWKNELKPVEYCAAKVYQANMATYAAAMVGSVVAKNAERPLHTMPDWGQLTGSIGRIADEWELDNDYLDQMHLLEGKYNDMSGRGGYTQSQLNAKYDELIKYSFKPFELAVIAPHKRIDMLYFEGLFKGTQTVSRTNNSKANVSYTFNLGVKQLSATTNWGEENATPIEDIKKLKDEARKKGRKILRLRMSENTFFAMCKAKEIKDTFRLNLGQIAINPTAPMISVDQMNIYLRSCQQFRLMKISLLSCLTRQSLTLSQITELLRCAPRRWLCLNAQSAWRLSTLYLTYLTLHTITTLSVIGEIRRVITLPTKCGCNQYSMVSKTSLS